MRNTSGRIEPVRFIGDIRSAEAFYYQIISKQGFVGGITVDGLVLFFRPDSGELALPAFQLPRGVAAAKGPALPGLWGGGLLSDTVIGLFKQIAFGYGVQVANAPAVHPTTGRVFITAAGPAEGDALSGVLYGLGVSENGVEIGFATCMGGGSGTSPALSPDGRFVFGAGQMAHRAQMQLGAMEDTLRQARLAGELDDSSLNEIASAVAAASILPGYVLRQPLLRQPSLRQPSLRQPVDTAEKDYGDPVPIAFEGSGCESVSVNIN